MAYPYGGLKRDGFAVDFGNAVKSRKWLTPTGRVGTVKIDDALNTNRLRKVPRGAFFDYAERKIVMDWVSRSGG